MELNDPGPDLDTLRAFALLARRSSFRAAARAIGLSPAAFSDRIRRLEEDLGTQLFTRTTRSVSLTAAGARLLPEAERVLARVAGLREIALGESGEPPYSLTLGTRFELGMSWLTPALSELSALRPHRTLHLAFNDGPDLERALADRRVDAFISSFRLTRTDLSYALLHEEHYELVASAELADERPLRRFADAATHTLLDVRRDLPLFRYFLDAAPSKQTWRFASTEFLGTIAAVRHRLLGGHGVAVLPRYFIESDLDAGDVVRVGPKVRLRTDWFRLVWPAEHPRGQQLEDLAEELRARPLC